MKIVFAGTSDFAVPCLEALVNQGYDIPLVITQADRPSGRGKKLSMTPVKEYALASEMQIFQPERISAPESLEYITALGDVDVFVVVAYGQKIPKRLLDWPRLGVVNVHGSLLPKYRGAAPIQQSVICGDRITGVTTMFMNEGWDEGDILLQRSLEIGTEENAAELSARLSAIGADLLVETLEKLAAGQIEPIPQDNDKVTFAYSLKRDAGAVDWNKDARTIVNQIRGCTPKPGAFARLDGILVKLWLAGYTEINEQASPGTVIRLDRNGIVVSAGQGCVLLRDVQPASRKRMSAADWARGSGIQTGKAFDSVTLLD